MKKLLLMAALCLTTLAAEAQSMIAYNLKTTNSALVPITDGTSVPVDYTGAEFSKLIIDGDGNANFNAIEAGTQGYPIGFNFTFDGKQMNQFGIGTDGTLYLGKDGIQAGAQTNPFLTFENDSNNIGLVSIGGTWGLDDTKISYKTEGTAGNRTLIVQYENLGIADRFADTAVAKVTLQYRLYENGNIQFKLSGFKPFEGASMQYVSLKMGIHGTGNDRLMLSDYSGNTTTSDRLISYSASSYPADGTTYTFEAPEPCEKPTTTVSSLKLSATSNTVGGTFKKASDADSYLVVASTTDDLGATPADKVKYATGSTFGNGTVIANSSDSTFTNSETLTPSTTYYVKVYAFNSKCIGGPVYNTTPVSGTVKTLAGAPSLNVASADTTKLVLSLQTADGQPAIIAFTDSEEVSRWGDPMGYGAFGTPSGLLNVGDTISGGAKIIYSGTTNDAITVNNLKKGTKYFFRAWSTDGNGNYSNLYADVATSTAFTLPYDADIANTPVASLPVGWTAGEGDWLGTRNGYLQNTIRTADETNGTVQYVTTAPVYLAKGTNRVKAEFAVSKYDSWSYYPYTFVEGDTLTVQVSDNGKDFSNVALYTKGEKFAGEDTYKKIAEPFTLYAGKAVWFRIYLRSHAETKVQVRSFAVEEKTAVDYPINLRDSVVEGTKAIIAWTPQGEGDGWELNYRKNGETEWAKSLNVTQPYAELDSLTGLTRYDVRVRTYNNAGQYSPWSEVLTFKSGLVVPFNEVFADEDAAPRGWASYKGKLDTPSVLTPSSDFFFYSSSWYGSTVEYSCYDSICNSWYVSPKFHLDPDTNKGIVATLGLTMTGKPYSGTVGTDEDVYIVIARDGEHFNAADAVKIASKATLPDEYESGSFTTDTIKGYGGDIRIALYVTTNETGLPICFTLDSIGLQQVQLPGSPATGINAATLSEGQGNVKAVAFYNESGQLMREPKNGLNIIRYSDGTVRKVILKR
ncbi:MAG: fibronectin type III domain-containing protein [Prevotella sp.]|nr:fibronectin type III domain-containing protein [Prevotella sp.]